MRLTTRDLTPTMVHWRAAELAKSAEGHENWRDAYLLAYERLTTFQGKRHVWVHREGWTPIDRLPEIA